MYRSVTLRLTLALLAACACCHSSRVRSESLEEVAIRANASDFSDLRPDGFGVLRRWDEPAAVFETDPFVTEEPPLQQNGGIGGGLSLLGHAIAACNDDPSDISELCARQRQRCALAPEKRTYDEYGLCPPDR